MMLINSMKDDKTLADTPPPPYVVLQEVKFIDMRGLLGNETRIDGDG